MGHTLAQWQDKVQGLLRDASGVQIADADATVVITQALVEHTRNAPRTIVVDITGSGTAYQALPSANDGWIDDLSEIREVEYPAGDNPRSIVDGQSWEITRDATTASLVKLVIFDETPAASEELRVWFTGRWPIPTSTVGDDLVNDLDYEGVAALAAAYGCELLATEAARDLAGGVPSDWVGGEQRRPKLEAAADRLRQTYRRICLPGSTDAGATGGKARPVGRPWDFDPSTSALFHGGRR